MTSKRAIVPIPQLIDPGRWQIKADNKVNLTAVGKKKMVVSLSNDPHSEARRAREMAKAKFSPLEFRHTSTTEAAENARISWLLERLGIEAITKEYTFPYQPASIKDTGCLYVELSSSKYHQTTLQKIEELLTMQNDTHSLSLITQAAQIIKDNPDSFESTAKAANLLDQLNGFTWNFEYLMKHRGLKGKEGINHKYGVEWGEMIIDKPALSLARRPKGLQKYIATNMGTALTFPHRYIIDRQVFGMRKNRIGMRVKGTVLIDASGSMQITSSQIRALVLVLPSATVALYGGLLPDNESGYLRIIASYGRITQVMRHEGHSGANVVDGPALSWLMRQSRPRIWVSDGDVRGKQDDGSPNLTYECQEIMNKGKILRYSDLATALEETQSGKLGESAVSCVN